MDSSHPAVGHPQHQSSVSDSVTIAQHMVISVNRMSVYLQIHDRSAVQLGADAPRCSGERSPDAVTGEPVSPKAPADHKRYKKIGGSPETLEEICVHIDKTLPADPGDPAKHRFRALRNRYPLSLSQSIDQVGDRRRAAVPSVGAVQFRELSGRKAVFISVPERT